MYVSDDSGSEQGHRKFKPVRERDFCLQSPSFRYLESVTGKQCLPWLIETISMRSASGFSGLTGEIVPIPGIQEMRLQDGGGLFQYSTTIKSSIHLGKE